MGGFDPGQLRREFPIFERNPGLVGLGDDGRPGAVPHARGALDPALARLDRAEAARFNRLGGNLDLRKHFLSHWVCSFRDFIS